MKHQTHVIIDSLPPDVWSSYQVITLIAIPLTLIGITFFISKTIAKESRNHTNKLRAIDHKNNFMDKANNAVLILYSDVNKIRFIDRQRIRYEVWSEDAKNVHTYNMDVANDISEQKKLWSAERQWWAFERTLDGEERHNAASTETDHSLLRLQNIFTEEFTKDIAALINTYRITSIIPGKINEKHDKPKQLM